MKSLLSLLLLAGLMPVQAEPHPLFSMMEGYQVSSHEEQVFAAFEFYVAEGQRQTVEGSLLRVGYLREGGLPAQTALAVMRNHEAAIRQMGGEIVATIGGQTSPVYLTFKLNRGGDVIWGQIDTTAGGNDFAITTVTVAAMKQEVTGQILSEGMARDGKVTLYDIYFDTGQATLRPESEAAIDALAEMLAMNPELSVYVVGHTDNVGSLASNLQLSRQRAAAVVQALVEGRGVAAGRLVAEGVGPLAPVASNASEEGRQRNRRVEVVAQ